MVSDPLGLPLPGPSEAGGGGAFLAPSLPLAPGQPLSPALSPQALAAAGASALRRDRGDGAVLALGGVTVPDARSPSAIRDSDFLCDCV